ncbi:MAG: hypothetical protein B6D61_08140 [Bacteroidetes bacterium 4484_249]|nr:MAG: hypothetical protein B6D61_08140 [Bacteroidetes bacterium 4484_249]
MLEFQNIKIFSKNIIRIIHPMTPSHRMNSAAPDKPGLRRTFFPRPGVSDSIQNTASRGGFMQRGRPTG